MAVIKSKEKSLNRKSNNDLVIELIGVLMCIAAIPVYAFFRNIYTSAVIIIIAFTVIVHFSKRRKIYKYGIEGEKHISKLLDTLNNKYMVYNDIVIGGKERGAQIDHLVLSPYGIFCIETKNMKGTITGREEDNAWKQVKTGQGGKTYEKSFYNPCKQSRGHVNAIKSLLRHGDFKNVLVYSIVAFNSNKEVNLKIMVKSTPVVKSDKLISFINSKKGITISDDRLKRIENIIDRDLKSK
ncbi:nuclease-related domain-containing protein [Clostridium arbusti]|uniref:nuclease-related domain-containing protein n=1 Tax=Clostridium arbusti TaxID=1137848 RepID=UPI000289278D|nr:nuclease-related domain-containing protein [Clostridium arbusti]